MNADVDLALLAEINLSKTQDVTSRFVEIKTDLQQNPRVPKAIYTVTRPRHLDSDL